MNEDLIVLSNRIDELEEMLALYNINGLSDAFSGRGNQTFGGGTDRLDKNGLQVIPNPNLSNASTAVWFVRRFSANPSLLTADVSELSGDMFTSYNTISVLARSPDGTGVIGLDLIGYNSADFISYFDFVGGPIWLPRSTSDPDAGALQNGMAWYRTDLFRARIKANGITGNIGMEIESASSAAVADNGTITTAGVSAARVIPAAAVTGVILAVGTTGGQMCTVVNEAIAARSVTFAAVATSNVADGAASVIAGLNARTFVWSSGTNLWYTVK